MWLKSSQLMCIYGSKRDREKLKRENKQKFGGVEKSTTAVAAVIQELLLRFFVYSSYSSSSRDRRRLP